jgi:hypothetical protein
VTDTSKVTRVVVLGDLGSVLLNACATVREVGLSEDGRTLIVTLLPADQAVAHEEDSEVGQSLASHLRKRLEAL